MKTVPTLTLTDGLQMPEILSDLMDTEVHVTELLSGVEWTATITRYSNLPGHIQVFEDGEFVSESRILYDQRIDFFLDDFLRLAPKEVERVILRGVLLNSFEYGLGSDQVRFFDIELNGEPVGPFGAFSVFQSWGLLAVPVLSIPGQTLYHWLNRRSPEKAARGSSRLYARERRGVVIRPAEELNHPEIGRLVVKLEANPSN